MPPVTVWKVVAQELTFLVASLGDLGASVTTGVGATTFSTFGFSTTGASCFGWNKSVNLLIDGNRIL